MSKPTDPTPPRKPRARRPRVEAAAHVEMPVPSEASKPPKRTPNTNPHSQTRTNVDRGGRHRILIQLEGKMADLYAGDITLADMDDEELARMQFKDKGGHWRGRPPANLPLPLVNMMRKELLDRMANKRREVLIEMQEVLIGIAKSPMAKEGDRIKAATAIIDRELGKTAEKVELSGGDRPIDIAVGLVKVKRGAREEG